LPTKEQSNAGGYFRWDVGKAIRCASRPTPKPEAGVAKDRIKDLGRGELRGKRKKTGSLRAKRGGIPLH